RTEVERTLCEVWEEVLGRERVGVADNFFSLGGDSILSLRLVSLLKARGLLLEVRDIFQARTIESLVPRLRGVASEEKDVEPFALLSEAERRLFDEDVEDAYPLSALQAGMVFHTQLEEFSGIYHDIISDHVRFRWNRGAFEQALASCIAEHPILRTGFRLDGERPLQFVRRQGALPLQVEDLRAMSEQEQEQHLASWTEAHKGYVFDWEHGPLFQIHVFLRSDESFQFTISFHHAILDGWSRASLTTALYNRYESLLQGETLQDEPVDRTYRRFIAAEQKLLADSEAKQFFASRLEEAPTRQVPRLKVAAERQAGAPVRQGVLRLEGLTPISDRLIALSMSMGVAVQSVLLAVHYKVLSSLSGRDVAVSCVTQNGRPESEGAERGLGLFLNSLPLAMKVEPASWRELIQKTADLTSASVGYRGYPLARIQQDLGVAFDEVTFNYTHYHVYNDMEAAGETQLEVLESSGFERTNFDFHVDISRGLGRDVLFLAFVYNADLYEEGFVQRIGAYYLRAFEQLLEDLDAPHLAAPLLDESELSQLRDSRNATVVAYDARPVQQQIAEQAQRTPASPAVVCGDVTLSYAELEARSNRLA
ncbi:hypothetical protein FKV24_010290, partial [Lysobacter maris]